MADPSETTQVSSEPAAQEREELLAAIRALATQVGGLQEELEALRAQPRSLPVPDDERPGWDDRMPVRHESAAWVRSLDAPTLRRPAIPWLLLEIAFLVAVAVLAVVARLDAPAVVAVMLAAWLLVALAEWTSTRAATRERMLGYGRLAAGAPRLSQDPSWFGPPVERRPHGISDAAETTATRLPPPSP